MTLPDWLPYHCLHCQTYRANPEEEFVECGSDHPEACDCDGDSHVGGYKCPTCGQNWKALPPEDWDGTLLVGAKKLRGDPPTAEVT